MIYIQTEGGKERGFGHITRSVALYQALKELGFNPWLLIDKDKDAMISHLLKGVNYTYFDIKQNLDYTHDKYYYIIDTYSKVKGIKSRKNIFLLTDEYTYDKPLVRKSFWKRPRKIGWYDKKLDMTQAAGMDEKTVCKMITKYKNLTVSGGQSFIEAYAIRDKNFNIMCKNINEFKQVDAIKVKPGKDTTLKCAKSILKELFKYDLSTPKKEDYKDMLRLRNLPEVRKASVNKKRVSWSEHVKHVDQFKDQITVAKHDNKLVGYIRVTKTGNISIVVDRKYRGLGVSEILLKHAKKKKKSLYANVYKYNIASMNMFKNAGFTENPYAHEDIALISFDWGE